MTNQIVQHGHCHNCGRAVKWGEKTCSEGCKTEYDARQKRVKTQQRLTLVLIVVALLVFVIAPLLGQVL